MTGRRHKRVEYYGTHRDPGPRVVDLSIPGRIIVILCWLLAVGVVLSMVWALIVNLALSETADDSPGSTPSPAHRIIATSIPTE